MIGQSGPAPISPSAFISNFFRTHEDAPDLAARPVRHRLGSKQARAPTWLAKTFGDQHPVSDEFHHSASGFALETTPDAIRLILVGTSDTPLTPDLAFVPELPEDLAHLDRGLCGCLDDLVRES